MIMHVRVLATLVLVSAAAVASTNRVDAVPTRTAPPPEQSVTAPPSDSDDLVVPILPKRRTSIPPPLPPPTLPFGADRIAPLTLDATIRRQTAAGRVHVLRQKITRTPERIHVAPGTGPEWLFERNPVDSRRVSGFLIDHASRSIVFHSDADLRAMFAVPGWAYVLTLGFDVSLLDGLKPSDDIRRIGGIRFTRFSRARQPGGLSDIWWNAEHLFPAEFVTSDSTGRARFSIDRIRAADLQVLRPPSSRFPEYGLVDLADWLERH
jgi:hypothetical protein